MENRDDRYYPVNAIRVCIDEYDGDIKGRIYSKMSREALHFENCGEMFLKADRLFDDCGYPQSFQEKRNFGETKNTVRYARPKEVLGDHEIRSQAGQYKTIDILIRSRRKTGWQGTILNNEGKQTERFESEMELLRHLGVDSESRWPPQGQEDTENKACAGSDPDGRDIEGARDDG